MDEIFCCLIILIYYLVKVLIEYWNKFSTDYIDNEIYKIEDIQIRKIIPTTKHINLDLQISNNHGISSVSLHALYIQNELPDAPVIILIHGTAGSCISFSKILVECSKVAHIYALDLPGFGRSHFYDINHAIKSDNCFYPDIINEFMKQLNINQAHICGHSFGGYVAINFAGLYPDKVLQLTLINPAGIFPTLGKWGAYWACFFKLGLTNIISKIGRLGYILADLFLSLENRYLYYLLAHPYGYGEKIFLRPKITISHHGAFWNDPVFLPNRYNKIKCSVKLIYGADDTIMPAHQGEALKQLYGCELVSIPNSGHNPMDEQSKLVAQHIITLPKYLNQINRNAIQNHKLINFQPYKYGSSFSIKRTISIIQRLYKDIGISGISRNQIK